MKISLQREFCESKKMTLFTPQSYEENKIFQRAVNEKANTKKLDIGKTNVFFLYSTLNLFFK